MRNIWLFSILFFLLPVYTASAAELPTWYKKAISQDDPNKLVYFATIRMGCGSIGPQLNEIIEGVLVRSRVKPVKNYNPSLYLHVLVECYSLSEDGPFVFVVRANFARYNPKPSVLFDLGYGDAGWVKERSSIIGKAKKVVEEAMADYMTANFNL